MNVATNLQEVLKSLPQGVKLVAVSKFQPLSEIEEAYNAGQRIFGESRAQELRGKHEALPKDIRWHFIGTLQTNKIKYIIPYVALIEGIDSYQLLEEVNRQAFKAGRIIDCLLQVHIAQEETKFGFTLDECRAMLEEGEWRSLSSVQVCGLMGMASNTDSQEQIAGEFRLLSKFFKEIKANYFPDQPSFAELSMGMSHDYLLAVKEGSTMVRVGTKIFGERK